MKEFRKIGSRRARYKTEAKHLEAALALCGMSAWSLGQLESAMHGKVWERGDPDDQMAMTLIHEAVQGCIRQRRRIEMICRWIGLEVKDSDQDGSIKAMERVKFHRRNKRRYIGSDDQTR